MNNIEELLNKAKICNHIITNKYEYDCSVYTWEKCLDCNIDIFTNGKYISCSRFILNSIYFYLDYKIISYTLNYDTKIIITDETNLTELIIFCKKYVDNLIFL